MMIMKGRFLGFKPEKEQTKQDVKRRIALWVSWGFLWDEIVDNTIFE